MRSEWLGPKPRADQASSRSTKDYLNVLGRRWPPHRPVVVLYFFLVTISEWYLYEETPCLLWLMSQFLVDNADTSMTGLDHRPEEIRHVKPIILMLEFYYS